jgi:hypothetical protein
MSSGLIAVVGVIYLAVSFGLYAEGKPWLALVFFAYALGNVGFYMVAR